MTFRFSPLSGREKRRTLTVLAVIAVLVSVIAVVFLIRIQNWHEKREFGDFIAIVNSENKVRRDWDDFTLLADDTLVDSRCADSFELMLQNCRQQGGSPVCMLSYISEYKHNSLFDLLCRMYKTEYNYSPEQSELLAQQLLGRPGHSEHQLGTAVDIFDRNVLDELFGGTTAATEDFVCAVGRSYNTLASAQRESPTYSWLCEHCWEYGFVLRYPEGGENSTGRDANYWHFRFVGSLAATQMHELGITLEEYNSMFY